MEKEEVESFLNPHLLEDIASANEDNKRGSLVDAIIQKLQDSKGINLVGKRAFVQECAIEAYFAKCAEKLCSDYQYAFRKDSNQARRNALRDLSGALTTVLAIDFPDIAVKDFAKKAGQALDQARKKRNTKRKH
ncbi:hypothetical protein [Parachlamydia acanthamoebae]|uniref:hypothetical protein n=1 Tax=Parachlamydia acanthamoebae TaxID=83552 RepID=UPI000750BC64|nr:hypothetical protein [Parachlamydia acanthamoebae]